MVVALKKKFLKYTKSKAIRFAIFTVRESFGLVQSTKHFVMTTTSGKSLNLNIFHHLRQKKLGLSEVKTSAKTNAAIASCGQSYKHFTIVIYDPRVVYGQFSSQYDSRVVNYNC